MLIKLITHNLWITEMSINSRFKIITVMSSSVDFVTQDRLIFHKNFNYLLS